MLKRLSPLFASCALAACLAGCAVTNSTASAIGADTPATASDETLFDDDNVLILLASEQEANELPINVSRRGYQLIDRQFLESLDLILLDFARPPGISDEVAVNDMQMMSPSALVGLDNIYKAQARMDAVSVVGGRDYANLLLEWPEQGCPAMTAVGIIDGYLSDRMSGLNTSQIISHNFARRNSEESEHAETVASLISGPGRLRDVMIYSAGVVGQSDNGQSGSGTDKSSVNAKVKASTMSAIAAISTNRWPIGRGSCSATKYSTSAIKIPDAPKPSTGIANVVASITSGTRARRTRDPGVSSSVTVPVIASFKNASTTSTAIVIAAVIGNTAASCVRPHI